MKSIKIAIPAELENIVLTITITLYILWISNPGSLKFAFEYIAK